MAKHAGGGGIVIAIPIALIVIIAFSLVLYFPLNPTLNVKFSVNTSTPVITVNSNNTATFYSKGTIFGTTGISQGVIILSRLGAQNSSYILSIVVSYGGNQLSAQNFTQIGDGNYQMRVVYGTRSESTSTPYSITLSLLNSGLIVVYRTNVTLFP